MTRALDVLGDRWTLVIVRDLFDGPRRFAQLRADLVGISPSLLALRLRALGAADVVEPTDLGYELTERGLALWPAVAELARWGLDLVDKPRPDDHPAAEHFPRLGLRFLVRPEAMPPEGLVADVDLASGPMTLVVEPATGGRGARDRERERVRLERAGHPSPHVRVRSTLGALTRLRQGRTSAGELERRDLLELQGTPAARRRFLAMLSPDAGPERRSG